MLKNYFIKFFKSLNYSLSRWLHKKLYLRCKIVFSNCSFIYACVSIQLGYSGKDLNLVFNNFLCKIWQSLVKKGDSVFSWNHKISVLWPFLFIFQLISIISYPTDTVFLHFSDSRFPDHCPDRPQTSQQALEETALGTQREELIVYIIHCNTIHQF